MVLMGEGGAEQRHDPISHDPVDQALIVVDRLQHVIEDGIEKSLRFFWITIGNYAERSHDVRKKDSDLLALAFKVILGCQYPIGEMLRRIMFR
jgi:hypothetical protein